LLKKLVKTSWNHSELFPFDRKKKLRLFRQFDSLKVIGTAITHHFILFVFVQKKAKYKDSLCSSLIVFGL